MRKIIYTTITYLLFFSCVNKKENIKEKKEELKAIEKNNLINKLDSSYKKFDIFSMKFRSIEKNEKEYPNVNILVNTNKIIKIKINYDNLYNKIYTFYKKLGYYHCKIIREQEGKMKTPITDIENIYIFKDKIIKILQQVEGSITNHIHYILITNNYLESKKINVDKENFIIKDNDYNYINQINLSDIKNTIKVNFYYDTTKNILNQNILYEWYDKNEQKNKNITKKTNIKYKEFDLGWDIVFIDNDIWSTKFGDFLRSSF